MQLKIDAISAFADNYIWCLQRGNQAFVVDPGDAGPVQEYLQANALTLAGILITHHHMDHVGGVLALRESFPAAQVFGPANPQISGIDQVLRAGASLTVLGLEFTVFEVPGHTLDHIAYYAASATPPLLFCGDTLFAAGCGRLFEGTPTQMHASLSQLAALPSATLVYCTHEYTLSNLRFAKAVEPLNADIERRFEAVTLLRSKNAISLPSSIGLERATNPFLRCDDVEVIAAARAKNPEIHTPERIFATLRTWKDGF